MGFFSSLHDITKWADPVSHYAIDATWKSSTAAVRETSRLLGDAADAVGIDSTLPRHWQGMANKDANNFDRWAGNTGKTALAVYGGMNALGGSGGTAAGSNAGTYTELGGNTVGTTANNGLAWSGGVDGAGNAIGAGATGAEGAGAATGSGLLSGAGSNGYLQLAQAGVGAAGSAYSAYLQNRAAQDAAAATLAQNQQTRADNAQWRIAGQDAVGMLAEGTAPGGYFAHQFNKDDLNANLAPNYAFSLDQGQRANQNAAGVGGGLVGGNALQGLDKWTQDYAQGAYQQAYQNFTGNQTNIFNRLSNIAGLGQTANQITTNAGTQNVANANNYLTSGAAANAAGVVGATNSVNNGINNYLGWQYANQHG